MNGIICIDKPADFTSFDVVAKMRGILKTRKIGHGGTLDPMATGVLPLLVGRATKACDMLPDQSKRYTATFRLGQTTDTQDITGTLTSTQPVSAGAEQVEQALQGFLGRQKQIPPMYSAVQVNGVRLYDLARQGIEVEREAREIEIQSIGLLEADEAADTYTIDVSCSKGTYIRTLCHDLGQQLGCGAVLTALRRTQACGFSIDSCLTLEEAQALAEENTIETRFLPVEAAFASYPELILNEAQTRLFRNGVRLSLRRMAFSGDVLTSYRVLGVDKEFLAVAKPDPDTDALISLKWFGIR